MLRFSLLNNGGLGADFLRQVYEQIEVVAENLRAERNCVAGGDGAVGPDLESQLVIVGQVAYTGVFNRVVDLVDRRVDRIHRNDADGGLMLLVLLSRNIAAAGSHRNLHGQAGIAHQSSDMQVGIQDLDFAVCVDVTGLDFALAGSLDVDRLGAVAMQLGNDALDVQHDLGYVFLNARDGGELVLYACNLDAGRCRTRQRRQQNAAQGVAQRGAISALQRLYDELAVGTVLSELLTVNTRFFDFDHVVPSFTLVGNSKRNRRSRRHARSKSEGLLFRVQLDDEVLSNFVVDVVTCRHCYNLALKGVVCLLDPLRASLLAVFLKQRLELGGGAGLLANCNYVARLNLEGRDVDALAVYGEVTVVNELASFAAGVAEAHAEYYVVKAALKLLEQDLTGDALLALSLLVVMMELLLENAVDKLYLLLLVELHAVLRLLAASLLGLALGRLGVTKYRRGKTKRLATLENGLGILSHLLVSSFYYTRRRFGGRQPLCGIGVTSLIMVTSRPAACSARIAASRPEPGPLT